MRKENEPIVEPTAGLGPFLGALLAAAFYKVIKMLEYETATPNADEQDGDDDDSGSKAGSRSASRSASRPGCSGAKEGRSVRSSLGAPRGGDTGHGHGNHSGSHHGGSGRRPHNRSSYGGGGARRSGPGSNRPGASEAPVLPPPELDSHQGGLGMHRELRSNYEREPDLESGRV